MFESIAYAMGANGQAGGQGAGNPLVQFAPIILMFVVFYFLLIRPQQKKAKEHRAMLSGLKRGDKVITSGGLYGRIVEINETTAEVDLGETKVTIARSALNVLPGSAPQAEKKADKK